MPGKITIITGGSERKSKTVSAKSARVGMLVYKPYHPNEVGVVRNIRTDTRNEVRLDVEWLDGRTTSPHPSSVNDFDALIDETARKLDTHRTTRAAVEKALGVAPR